MSAFNLLPRLLFSYLSRCIGDNPCRRFIPSIRMKQWSSCWPTWPLRHANR